MSSIPLVALGYRSPEPVDALGDYAKAQGLRAAIEQQQFERQRRPLQLQQEQQQIAAGQQEIQQRQLAMHQAQVTQQLLPQFATKDETGKVTGYDYDGYFNALRQNGVDPTPVQEKHQQYLDSVQKYKTSELAQQSAALDRAFEQIEGVKQIQDPQQRQVGYASMLAEAKQNKLHGADQFPQQAPDNNGLAMLESLGGMHAQALKDTAEQAATAEKLANARKLNFEAQFGTGDVGQYVSNYLAAHKLENTPENRLTAHAAFTKETKTDPGVFRVEAMGQTREYPVTDSRSGTLQYMSAADINAANRLQPGRFAPAQYDVQTQGNLAAGKEATKNVPVIQTALHHIDALEQAADALNSGDVKALNSVANLYKVQTGDTPLATYRGLQQVVKGDILAASSAVGSKNEQEERAINDITDPAIPTKALKASLGSVRSLMNQRLQAKEATFNAAKGGGNIFTPQGQSKVTMKAPNGQTKQVDPSEVEHYKSMGAQVVSQ